jgi:hypothetical protein
MRPSVPQAKACVPSWHSSFASQQPAQFDRKHRFVVVPQAGVMAAMLPIASPTRNARALMWGEIAQGTLQATGVRPA